MRSTLLVLCLLAALPAAARMYQWTNPATGTVQLSGSPPPWYRGGHGPRVLVFDHGTLIDDTAIGVSYAQREELRGTAFGLPATPVERATPASEPAAAPSAGAPPAAPAASAQTAPPAGADEPAAPASAAEDAKAAAFKAMIEAWDQRQVDQARAVIEGRSAPPALPAPPR